MQTCFVYSSKTGWKTELRYTTYRIRYQNYSRSESMASRDLLVVKKCRLFTQNSTANESVKWYSGYPHSCWLPFRIYSLLRGVSKHFFNISSRILPGFQEAVLGREFGRKTNRIYLTNLTMSPGNHCVTSSPMAPPSLGERTSTRAQSNGEDEGDWIAGLLQVKRDAWTDINAKWS